VHVVGSSSLGAGQNTLVPERMARLYGLDASDIVVSGGCVILEQDYPALKEAGVRCIFGPGTAIPQAAREVLGAVNEATN